jgi:putative peptidoglycan lipid II flippase
MIPGTFGLAATQVNILVNSVLATGAGAGAVSWLNYAFRLMQFPIGIFGVSLAQATLPRISAHWARGEHLDASQTLRKSLLHVFAINLPAAAGLAALGVPLISVLFEHGRFGASDTAQTAYALAAYSVGLAAYSGVKVLVPVFYAFGNTRIPVLSSLLSVGVTIGLNLFTVRVLGFWGLALGTSIAAFVNMGYLLVSANRILRQKGADFGLFWLVRKFMAHAGLSIGMALACHLTWSRLGWVLGNSFGAKCVVLGGLVLEGALVVLAGAWILGLEETRDVFRALWSRVSARIKTRFSKKTV